MSQRLVTTDDHTGDEITTNLPESRASVTLARNDHSLTWPDIHMTDESWDGLIKLVRDYFPGVEPTGVEAGLDDDGPTAADEASAAADEARAVQQAQTLDAATVSSAGTAKVASAERLAAQLAALPPAPTRDPATMTQAARKARSAAMRAWWYALDAQSIKALGLKTPNRAVTRGKLPPAVVDAYEASHQQ